MTDTEKIRQIRNVPDGSPFFIGAGMTAEICRVHLRFADGAIMCSRFRKRGVTLASVDPDSMKQVMKNVKVVRFLPMSSDQIPAAFSMECKTMCTAEKPPRRCSFD